MNNDLSFAVVLISPEKIKGYSKTKGIRSLKMEIVIVEITIQRGAEFLTEEFHIAPQKSF